MKLARPGLAAVVVGVAVFGCAEKGPPRDPKPIVATATIKVPGMT